MSYCRYNKRGQILFSVSARVASEFYLFIQQVFPGGKTAIVLNEKPLNLLRRHWYPGQEQFLVEPAAGYGLREDP